MLSSAFYLVATSILPAAAAAGNPTVVWLQTDWAPHQILEGPHLGKGTFDLLLKRLAALLPQYQHQSRLISLGRIEPHFQRSDEIICIAGSLYTEERASTRYYSLPVAIGPGFAVNYVSTSMVADYVESDLTLDINKLAQHPELIGAYQPNRYYPEVMLQAIGQQGSNLLATEFTSELNAAALLHSRRIDYVIEYPERMQFYQRNLAYTSDIASAALLGASPYSVSYITCNKHPLSQQLITEINQVLPVLWQADDFQELLFYWLDQNARQILLPKFLELKQQMAEKNRP